jgi:hypothetical protein
MAKDRRTREIRSHARMFHSCQGSVGRHGDPHRDRVSPPLRRARLTRARCNNPELRGEHAQRSRITRDNRTVNSSSGYASTVRARAARFRHRLGRDGSDTPRRDGQRAVCHRHRTPCAAIWIGSHHCLPINPYHTERAYSYQAIDDASQRHTSPSPMSLSIMHHTGGNDAMACDRLSTCWQRPILAPMSRPATPTSAATDHFNAPPRSRLRLKFKIKSGHKPSRSPPNQGIGLAQPRAKLKVGPPQRLRR